MDVTGPMRLVAPSASHLPRYLAAAERGWSSQSASMDPVSSAEEGALINRDPVDFIDALNDPLHHGEPVTLPSGEQVPRLPSVRRWMWDGDYCGAISLRWQEGTMDLPPHCLGHIGYAVVPWKRRLGYATSALAQMLVIARERGMSYVDIVTDVDNVPSQAVVLANGGVLVREFTVPESQGGFAALLFRVSCDLGLPPVR